MTKWDYIKQISQCGSRYGEDGGILDLLKWTGKDNTAEVTGEEAREFWETRHLRAQAVSAGNAFTTAAKRTIE